jgi:hypothetical protein
LLGQVLAAVRAWLGGCQAASASSAGAQPSTISVDHMQLLAAHPLEAIGHGSDAYAHRRCGLLLRQ